MTMRWTDPTVSPAAERMLAATANAVTQAGLLLSMHKQAPSEVYGDYRALLRMAQDLRALTLRLLRPGN